MSNSCYKHFVLRDFFPIEFLFETQPLPRAGNRDCEESERAILSRFQLKDHEAKTVVRRRRLSGADAAAPPDEFVVYKDNLT